MRTIVIILLLLTSGLTGWSQSENDFYRDMIKKPVASKEDLVRAVARFRGYRGPDMAQEEAQHLLSQGVRFRKSIMKAIRAPVTKGEAVNLFLNAMDSAADQRGLMRSEEHTSELQSQSNLVCRLLLVKKTTSKHKNPNVVSPNEHAAKRWPPNPR